uniref:Uncharacterized protein n=1 Tax=Plectus sambesii TaxID=2011161 RepID=A0A914VBZ0_9BILA
MAKTTTKRSFQESKERREAMLGTTARASLLRPFGAFEQAVRWNCPWFRNNFRPSFFPFKLEDKLKRQSVEARTKTRGGRLLLMRKVLRE